MDPDENLRRQLEIAATKGTADDQDADEELAELVLALHEWITRGGFLPKAWEDKTLRAIAAGKGQVRERDKRNE